jgi:hypothetical protein
MLHQYNLQRLLMLHLLLLHSPLHLRTYLVLQLLP